MGLWTFRPTIQVRTRFEGRRNPFDTAGLSSAQAQGSVIRTYMPPIKNQWMVLGRGRMGIKAERGVVGAAVELQDARVWGEPTPYGYDGRDAMPNTAARLAYAQVQSLSNQGIFLRLGRQEIVWGEGRLLGASDWSPTGRSLDAVRGSLALGEFDFDAFAAIIRTPGALAPEVQRDDAHSSEGTGAQVYGLRVAWNTSPWLVLEWNNLARVVRAPTSGLLVPGDLVLSGLRFAGNYLGLSYSVEGAYEFGRVAVVGATAPIRAYAGVARVEWTTTLAGQVRFGAQGSYASGQDQNKTRLDPTSAITRFDPILPDVRTAHGPMGLYAWSNIIEAAAFGSVSPAEELRIVTGYRYVALAVPSDTWQSATLFPIGNAPNNTARTLGHEIDAAIEYAPWDALSMSLGYGAFVTGPAAKSILVQAARGQPSLQHFAYLQTTVRMP